MDKTKVGYPVKINGTTEVPGRPGCYWVRMVDYSSSAVFNRSPKRLNSNQVVILEIGNQMPTMSGDEIFKHLSEMSSRWGTNEQPSIYLITALLEQLPVVHLAGGFDRFQISFSRELTPLEHWAIDRLTPDSIHRDGRHIDLWWD